MAGWTGMGVAAHPALAASLCVGTESGCYSSIQAALDAAHDGDVIHIGPGTFSGGVTVNVSVTIIGAGAGVTIIKGGGPVVTIGRRGASVEPTVTISGVTITGGMTTNNLTPFFAVGGGVEIPWGAQFGTPGATVRISNSVITSNTASPSTTTPSGLPCGSSCPFAGAFGGGIDNAGHLTLTDTRVSDNLAGALPGKPGLTSDANGAGIYTWQNATLTITGSVITGNRANVTPPYGRFADGGGILAEPGAVLTLRGSTVSDNAADVSAAIPTAGPNGTQIGANSGGIHVTQDFGSGTMAKATIQDSTVSGNEVSVSNQSGDAVAFSGGIDNDGSLVLLDSTVSNNRVSGASAFSGSPAGNAITDSGAIEIEGPATISDTRITGNSASAASTQGLAVVNPGGVGATPSQPMTISDSVINGNSANATSTAGQAIVQGGGLLVDAVVTLRNTTVSHNTGAALRAWRRVEASGTGILVRGRPR
jgi:hypothetical protein